MYVRFKSLLQFRPGQSSHFNKDYRANVQFISILHQLSSTTLFSFNVAQNILYSHGCSVAASIWQILFWVSIFRKLNSTQFICNCFLHAKNHFHSSGEYEENGRIPKKKYRQKCQFELDPTVDALMMCFALIKYISLWHAMASFQVWT